MRIHLLTAVLLAGIAATPAIAQREVTVDQRVNRLEQQMRAVQRRVFPNGAAAQIEPEIRPATPTPAAPAVTGSAIADLSARVDALESQLAALTGQVEESAFRTRQIEEALNRLREESNTRLGRLETAATPPAATPPAAAQPTAERPAPARELARTPTTSVDPDTSRPAAATDSVEEAYNAGFRLWQARRYEEAQSALKAVADRNPRSRWASWARNLEGRAYLDDNKPATAARVFLSNYQDNPTGERAADSLYYLGQALTQLNRKPEACRVYDELAQEFPNVRSEIRNLLPAARRAASCSN